MNRDKCTHDFLDHESDILNELCADFTSACGDSFTQNLIVSEVITNLKIPVHLVSSKNDSKSNHCTEDRTNQACDGRSNWSNIDFSPNLSLF
jgi:hypothetical protein